jgi:SAM-dependent methyltransferase
MSDDFLEQTRTSYDTIAAYYTQWVAGELAKRPVERGLLTAFAEVVARGDVTTIADIGCGPGRVTAYLASLGADVFGIDLSLEMVEQARIAHPDLRFEVGSMLELDLADASLGGIVAWYSIIHVPDELLPIVFAEFRRVLVRGGQLLLGFQLGDDILHRDDVDGFSISLDFRRRGLDQVAELLNANGFDVRVRLHREPHDDLEFPERTPQGFLMAEAGRRTGP